MGRRGSDIETYRGKKKGEFSNCWKDFQVNRAEKREKNLKLRKKGKEPRSGGKGTVLSRVWGGKVVFLERKEEKGWGKPVSVHSGGRGGGCSHQKKKKSPIIIKKPITDLKKKTLQTSVSTQSQEEHAAGTRLKREGKKNFQ